MTVEFDARFAPSMIRLPARSAVAGANVELARNTLAELVDHRQSFEITGERVLARLRRLVVRDDEVSLRS